MVAFAYLKKGYRAEETNTSPTGAHGIIKGSSTTFSLGEPG